MSNRTVQSVVTAKIRHAVKRCANRYALGRGGMVKAAVIMLAALSLPGCYYYAYETDPVNRDVYYGRESRDYHAYPVTAYGGYGPYRDWAGVGFFGPFGYVSYWDHRYYTYGYPYRYSYPYYAGHYRYYPRHHHGRHHHGRGHHRGHHDGDRHRGHRRDRYGDRDGGYQRPRTGRHLGAGRVREDHRQFRRSADGRDKGGAAAVPRNTYRPPAAAYDGGADRAGSYSGSTGSRAPSPNVSAARAAPPPPATSNTRGSVPRAAAPRRSSAGGGSKGERKRRQ